MKTRTDLLNFLAEKYQLKRYLEIGLQNASQNFDKVKCEYKFSVDPDPKAKATQCRTSDDFFRYTQDHISINPEGTFQPFDLIFIDGLHTAEQVKKDFENSLKIISPKGFIVLHDCNPEKEEHTIVPRPTKTGHWNGDVYKFAVDLTQETGVYTVAIDNGMTIYVNPKRWEDDYELDHDIPNTFSKDMTWDYFNENRKELLNLISWDEFIKL
jgi:hypothetical protein